MVLSGPIACIRIVRFEGDCHQGFLTKQYNKRLSESLSTPKANREAEDAAAMSLPNEQSRVWATV